VYPTLWVVRKLRLPPAWTTNTLETTEHFSRMALRSFRERLKAFFVLQFPDPALEQDFVLQTGITGLSMTR
jgi:hypothetical protein